MDVPDAIAEDATQLRFFKDMDRPDTTALMIGEVHAMLLGCQHQRAEHNLSSEKFQRTLEYCQRFDAFKSKEMVADIRRMLTDAKDKLALHKYEAAALGSLCPSNVEEARCLIPSFAGKDELMVEDLVNEMNDYRNQFREMAQ